MLQSPVKIPIIIPCVLFLCFSFLLQSLWAKPPSLYQQTEQLQGKIKANRYISPKKHFSCQVPFIADTVIQITDDYGKYGGFVHFSDERGTFFRVTFLSPDRKIWKLFKSPNTVEQYLRDFQNQQVLPQIQELTSKPLQIIHQEYNKTAKSPMLYTLVRIPEASAFMEAETDRRADTIRGLLIFSQNPYLFSLSIQEKRFQQNRPIPIQEMRTHHLNQLLEYFQTMEIR